MQNLSAAVNQEEDNLLEQSYEEVLRLQKLALLGELNASTMHEMSNTLAICGMTLDQLKDRIGTSAKCEIDAKEIAHLLRAFLQINAIAATAKSIARNSTPDPLQKFSVSDLVEGVSQFLTPFLVQKQIRLHVEIPTDLFVWGRPGQLTQVLINLTKNAAEAIADQKDKWISFVANRGDKATQLRITDSGSGFSVTRSDEDVSAVVSSKPAGVGTGLGLKISGELMKAQGGSLTLDMASSNTCFVISFPRRQS